MLLHFIIAVKALNSISLTREHNQSLYHYCIDNLIHYHHFSSTAATMLGAVPQAACDISLQVLWYSITRARVRLFLTSCRSTWLMWCRGCSPVHTPRSHETQQSKAVKLIPAAMGPLTKFMDSPLYSPLRIPSDLQQLFCSQAHLGITMIVNITNNY